MKFREIAFVCYAVTSISKAKEFYEGVLGLNPTQNWVKDDANGMIEYDIGPGTLSIGAGAENFKPGKNGATAALEVEDFDLAIEELKAKKVNFILAPLDSGICKMVIIEDPDGNQIVIHRRKGE